MIFCQRSAMAWLMLSTVGLNIASSVFEPAFAQGIETPYFGQIKRNEKGDIVAVPAPAPSHQTHELPLTTTPRSAPAVPVVLPAPYPEKITPAQHRAVPAKQSASASPLTLAEPGKLIRVGPSRSLRSVAAAAAVAKNGDTIEIDAGDYLGDVAVWTQDRLTIRSIGGKTRLIANGKNAEGKAIWVMRGGHITVENIIFSGAKAQDRNGAGIRFETGLLIIRNCAFLNNENGILGGNADAQLIIENSEFGYNGHGDGQSHGAYIGAIKRLQVTGSYFHHNNEGHLLKSRAAENIIMYNRLTDEIGGIASYELEFPNGGLAYVVGNIIEQSPTTQNSTIVSYGMEGFSWPTNELYLNHNTLVDDKPGGGLFLKYRSGAQKIHATNNLLIGKGNLTGGPVASLKSKMIDMAKRWLLDIPEPPSPAAETGQILLTNNITASSASFEQASKYDYRIKDMELSKSKLIKVAPVNGIPLEPTRQYIHPARTKILASPIFFPGALQQWPQSAK